MKKSNKCFVAILSVIIAAVLFSIPISFLTEKVAKASGSKEDVTISSVSEGDYVFVLIEDEPVALAATPFVDKSSNMVIGIVLISLALMLVISYFSWYSMVLRNIYNYSHILPDSEIESLIPSKAFIHPIELSAAEVEVQYRAAKKFV